MEHIRFNITTSKNQVRKAQAVAKWQSDLDWVRNYGMKNQCKVRLNSIKRAYS
jgi:hypothetical protein